MNIQTTTPQAVHNRYAKGESIRLIDVRTPVEYREVHSPYARNVPLDSIDELVRAKGTDGGLGSEPIYLICRSGNRSSKACEKLISSGLTNVISVEGGMQAWDAAGLPVERGKKAISLERQVRIAAGLLVLIGAILALTVHPYWAGLSAFVGAGLVFAGITDTCGMAMVLAKMPWNRIGGKVTTCETVCHGE